MAARLGQAYGFGRLLPYAALSSCCIVALMAPSEAESWGRWVFMASMVFLGLPHGAVDHVVMARMSGVQVLSLEGLKLVAFYILAVGAVLFIWLLAPAAVLVGFIALTWFHWGQGDAWYAGAEPFRPSWWVTMISRGYTRLLERTRHGTALVHTTYACRGYDAWRTGPSP